MDCQISNLIEDRKITKLMRRLGYETNVVEGDRGAYVR
jgi:hypothetical protein